LPSSPEFKPALTIRNCKVWLPGGLDDYGPL